MPMGSRHRLTGTLERAPRGLLLRFDDGGVYVLDIVASVTELEGRRVVVEGSRSGFDKLGAEWIGSIGRWPIDKRDHRHSKVIRAWAEERGFDGVVWTDLQPGMKGDRKREPSLDEVLRHLDGLNLEARERAAEYVRRAPEQIATPNRGAIEAALFGG